MEQCLEISVQKTMSQTKIVIKMKRLQFEKIYNSRIEDHSLSLLFQKLFQKNYFEKNNFFTLLSSNFAYFVLIQCM